MGGWLAWRHGDGNLIKVGEDPIMGLKNSYKIFESLINVLHEKGLYSLSHVSKYLVLNVETCNWLFSIELELLD